MKRIDIQGQRFGRLVVSAFATAGKWQCLCDCGAVSLVTGNALRTGRQQSCGCLHRILCKRLNSSHGHAAACTQSPTYRSWHAMRQRCGNPKHKHYPRYGGAGIKVCDRWRYFKNFLHDMGERPDGKELSRLDESKGYEPGNVVWETHLQNVLHRDSSNCGPRRKA
jgi:hypothetical protein